MKTLLKLLIIFVILALAIIGGLAICKYYGKCNFLNKRNPKKLIATSDYGNVYYSDLEDYIGNLEKIFSKSIDIDKITKEEKTLIINEIVNQKKILSDAKKSGIEHSDEFASKLEKLKDDLVKEIYLKNLIEENVTDDAVKTKYFELKESLKDKNEYKVKHILVKTEPEIKNVVEELKSKSFEEVAKKYSIDTTAQNGGDLGIIVEGQTVKEFEEACKKAELNKVSKPFKTEYGWHVLLKTEQKSVVIPEFDAIKDNLKTELINTYIKNFSATNIQSANINIIDK